MHFLSNIWWGEVHNNNQPLFQCRSLHSCLQKCCQHFTTMRLAYCHIDETSTCYIYLFNPWVWWHTFCNLLSNFIWWHLNTYTTNFSVLNLMLKRASECSRCDAVWPATGNFIATQHKDVLLKTWDSTLPGKWQTHPLISNSCLKGKSKLLQYINTMWIESTGVEFHMFAMLRNITVHVACVLFDIVNYTVYLEQVLSGPSQGSMGFLCIMYACCITALPLCLLPLLFVNILSLHYYIHIFLSFHICFCL